MISLSLSNITLILGGRTLFAGLNFEVREGQRIGLIGPNGAGKSSLFKLIVGEYAAEAGGNVARARGVRLGYLPQEPTLDQEQSALALALAGNERMAAVQGELAQVEARLGEEDVYST